MYLFPRNMDNHEYMQQRETQVIGGKIYIYLFIYLIYTPPICSERAL